MFKPPPALANWLKEIKAREKKMEMLQGELCDLQKKIRVLRDGIAVTEEKVEKFRDRCAHKNCDRSGFDLFCTRCGKNL